MQLKRDMGDSTLTKSPRTWSSSSSSITLCVLIMYADKLFTVNGQGVVDPAEALSSSRYIIATRGSSVWLHWNYTYIGDGPQGPVTTLSYKEQIIGFNSTSQPTVQTLAKRIGQNGVLTLESPVPPPFNGRVKVISSNSTLVIHNLQYNDSAYQFSSNVKVDSNVGGTVVTITYSLKPVVSITVNGIPDFIVQPPSTTDISEGSSLQLRIEMDGNPNPSAHFKWPHITGSSPTNVPSVQLYPYVYSSTYTLNKIGASYCGRILQTTLRNSVGSSSVTASTNVTVLLTLDMDFGLKAGKNGLCVEVKWNKVDSGACYVKYEVVLKSASGSNEYIKSGYNIREMTICSFNAFSNVTTVQLTISFKATSRNVTAIVSDTPISTPAPPTSESTSPSVSQTATASVSSPIPGSSENTPTTNPNTKPPASDSNIGVIVGASVGGVVFLVIVIGIIIFYRKKSKRRRRDTDSGSPDYPLQDDKYAVANELSPKQPHDLAYEDPNKSISIYGKLGENARDIPNYTRGEGESYYAHVKGDRAGYPASGAVPTSATNCYAGK